MRKIIKFPSELHNIRKAEDIVEDIASIVELNEEHYGNILVSLSEAINNAITHGNKFDKEKLVTVIYSVNNDIIEISVEDEGEGFDPDSIPDPTAPENIEKETGRGIFIIKHLSDEVCFEKNGAKIIMKFKINKQNNSNNNE